MTDETLPFTAILAFPLFLISHNYLAFTRDALDNKKKHSDSDFLSFEKCIFIIKHLPLNKICIFYKTKQGYRSFSDFTPAQSFSVEIKYNWKCITVSAPPILLCLQATFICTPCISVHFSSPHTGTHLHISAPTYTTTATFCFFSSLCLPVSALLTFQNMF